MDWIVTIGESWLNTLGWLAGLTVGFGILVRLMPCNPGMYWWKGGRAVVTDFLYWFIVPLFLAFGKQAMLFVGVVALYGGQQPEFRVKEW